MSYKMRFIVSKSDRIYPEDFISDVSLLTYRRGFILQVKHWWQVAAADYEMYLGTCILELKERGIN